MVAVITECLFGAYSYGMENMFARNKQSSRMSGKHVVNSGCTKGEQLQTSYQSY